MTWDRRRSYEPTANPGCGFIVGIFTTLIITYFFLAALYGLTNAQ